MMVAKCFRQIFPRKKRSQKGQLSIFLGTLLLTVMSLLAFVINVGLFVKAKINLQNAVDAAAWSGAAVQARQLTNMSYLNWELRNTYKEWMFKYYVVGQLGLEKTHIHNIDTPAQFGQPGGGNMNFRSNPFWAGQPNPIGDDGSDQAFDKFNLPSVCIHFGSAANICQIQDVPGLPRFGSEGLPSISEANESFLNVMVSEKAKNCSRRTALDFATTMTWTFGIKEPGFINNTVVAGDRLGAWVEALELGFRMRNLEFLANRPPIEAGICNQTSAAPGCISASVLHNDPKHIAFGYNDRPFRAFQSAHKNLGEELKRTFVLKEIAPKPFITTPDELSGYLIKNVPHDQGGDSLTKYYVDLKIMPLNYTIFFTSFVTSTRGGAVTQEASCSATKTAIPVPGYILGFVKNPEVLTYYAVKGEAKHIGLFFPFTETDGIKISAYAAAKPFGGRIGPMLFNVLKDKRQVFARDRVYRSSAYMSSLVTDPAGPNFISGYPIPLDPSHKFWAKDSDPVGGPPLQSGNIFFGIPNLIYDYVGTMGSSGQTGSGGGSIDGLMGIEHKLFNESYQAPTEAQGLYAKPQFKALASNLPNLGGNSSATISTQNIYDAIFKVRSPTPYEALNYLIPTASEANIASNMDSASLVVGKEDNKRVFSYSIYAPLFGAGLIYDNNTELSDAVSAYLKNIDGSVQVFLNTLKEVAASIKSQPSAGATFNEAALEIYDDPASSKNQSGECSSIAGKFGSFFSDKVSTGKDCGSVKPLAIHMLAYFTDEPARNANFQTHYFSSFFNNAGSHPTFPEQKNWMTAYAPGTFSGARNNAEISHPLINSIAPTNGQRNFYSTKFVGMAQLLKSGPNSYSNKIMYAEGPLMGDTAEDLTGSISSFLNPIDPADLSEFGPDLNF